MKYRLIFPSGYNAFIPSFKTSTFVTSYIGVLLYLFNIVSYKIFVKTEPVKLQDMDLQTGRQTVDGSN